MNHSSQPLAARMRPRTIDDFIGQQHLVGPGKPLRQAVEKKILHSMILWGPPGTGKTTLARILADNVDAHMEQISAVLAGVKDVREIVKLAKQLDQPTVLFVDEVHRFNKAQQDAFLPFVEDGTITLIGATTENPSFELNNALLSRARVYVLKALSNKEIEQIIQQALADDERGLGGRRLEFAPGLIEKLLNYADGDARQALNMLEIAADFAVQQDGKEVITAEVLEDMLSGGVRRFDKGGEHFYDQISALHKSIRGSSPDAALYWFARMIDGGCDPRYLARRLVRMASEDIGNADPRALMITMNAWEAYERIGSPEGELMLAQAVIFLASAAKSNAGYMAFGQAMKDAKELGTLEVPMKIRNAPTRLMKDLGHGNNYRYAHNEKDAYAAGENYFPDEMTPRQYYHPTERGMEAKIKEKLDKLRELDKSSG